MSNGPHDGLPPAGGDARPGAKPSLTLLPLDRRGMSRQESAQPTPPPRDEWDALEGMARTLTTSGWYRVVRRFKGRDRYVAPSPSGVLRALYVDVETTGLDVATDRIIELALVPFEFDSDGVVYAVGRPVSYFEDPGVPIPEEITALTSITNESVRGAKIDDAAVNALLADCVLVIAHNAEFDRKILERRLAAFADKHWACSQKDVPWVRFGCAATKLEYLLFRVCGEFHEGHRAADDCLAGIHLLADPRCEDGTPMTFLIQSAREARIRLWAVNAPFDAKDLLKRRGYRFSGDTGARRKTWYRDVREDALEAEQAWLRNAVYGGRADVTWPTDRIGARDRYSTRA